ncbi:hypothetical protein BLOT_000460 [Blomia tropicalis]|nr:hypothetical protein BLOT_000460 [Blomia tropicalis]
MVYYSLLSILNARDYLMSSKTKHIQAVLAFVLAHLKMKCKENEGEDVINCVQCTGDTNNFK